MTESDRIDEIRRRAFARDGGRPNSRALAPAAPSDEVRRARKRLRTAAYRVSLDRRRRPEAQAIGMALVRALVQMRRPVDEASTQIVDLAFRSLVERGYDRGEIEDVLRSIRDRQRRIMRST